MSLPAAGMQEISGRKPHQEFKGHTRSVFGVIHLPDRERIITCSEDGSLRLWNLKNGLQIGEDWRDGKSAVRTIALSPDEKTVASGSEDGAVQLWDVTTGKVIAKWTGHSVGVWSICWNQDGRQVLSGSEDGDVKVWDVESGKTTLQIEPTNPEHEGMGTAVCPVVYSPDETMIASGGSGKDERKIKIWDAKTLELVATLEELKGNVWCLAWTNDGKTLISGSGFDSGCIRKWNTTTWKQSAVLTEQGDSIRAIAISPNGRILASASYDKTARLWNLENDQPIGSPLQHPRDVFCVSFSADGALLATGCADNSAYTWDISAIVKEAGLDELLLDSDVSSCAFPSTHFR